MAISRSQIPSQIDPFATGGDVSIKPEDVITPKFSADNLSELALLSQNLAKLDYGAGLQKYKERLNEFKPTASKPDIFDLASQLGAGLSSVPNRGGASIGAGLSAGFNSFHKNLVENEKLVREQERQIGLQASQLAMRDEQQALDYMSKMAIERIKAGRKDLKFTTIEYDKPDADGKITRVKESIPNTPDNRDRIIEITEGKDENYPNAVVMSSSGSTTNLNMPPPVSQMDKSADKALQDSIKIYKEKSDSAGPILDQVGTAYLLAIEAGRDNFGPVSRATLGAKEFLIEMGLGGVLEDPDSIPALKALNQLSMSFTMAIVSQTKGAISNKEMQLFIDASPTLGSTYEGFLKQIQLLEKLAMRDRDFYQDFLTEMGGNIDKEIPVRQLQLEMEKYANTWREKNPLLSEEDRKILNDAIAGTDQYGGSLSDDFVPDAYRLTVKKAEDEFYEYKSGLIRVMTQEQYDAVDEGEQYIGKDGRIATKREN